MRKTIDKDKCDTCIHAWTDECPLQKCWEYDYKYYEKHYERQTEEKMGMKRLTYDVGEKHYCDYSTREIINRLAECEIMLEKIEKILNEDFEDYHTLDRDPYRLYLIRKVIEDGNDCKET